MRVRYRAWYTCDEQDFEYQRRKGYSVRLGGMSVIGDTPKEAAMAMRKALIGGKARYTQGIRPGRIRIHEEVVA